MRRLLLPLLLLLALVIPSRPADAASLVHFRSLIYPYSISYPAGWRHTSGHFSGGFSLFAYDQFFDPARGHTIPANVLISRIPYAGTQTDASLLATYERALRAKGRLVTEVGTAQVLGHRLTLLAYSDVAAHLQAYLALDGNGWTFGLTTPRGDQARWRPVFVGMLGSFRPGAGR